MIAYVTSIGEPTTDLSVWALKRNGYEVKLVQDDTSLAEKLRFIYNGIDEDFVRVDADVVVNRKLKPNVLYGYEPKYWWLQFMMYDWYKQDLNYGGIQFIKKQALPALRKNINTFLEAERPESQMYRLNEFVDPQRRCISVQQVMGLHGYGQNDIERIKATKQRRRQYDYDWNLAEKLGELCSR